MTVVLSGSAALASALAGRYRLEHALGAGGVATVWLARDLKHDRAVALEALRPEVVSIPDALFGWPNLRRLA